MDYSKLYNESMPAPVLATKLFIPPARPNAVPRPRLIERLNEGLRAGHKLALISAPAGFGKTTLVSNWIADCRLLNADWTNEQTILNPQSKIGNLKFSWLSLDEGDSDLARFLMYFVAAMQTISPNFGEGVLHTLHASQSQPPTDALLTTLLNELAIIPDRFILVLDDYHTLDCKPIDAALTFLLDHLPPQLQLIITTREDPQLPLARLRARSQLTELRAADLRFTPAEAAEFLNHAMGLGLSPDDIAALESRTEGWIAGLQLAALSMQGRSDAASFIGSFTGTHHFVLDYLLEEVLHQQSEDIQTFLLRTSILDRLCGPLCETMLLTPAGSGQDTLEYLERANLFIVPLDNKRQWYRYHRLFADLLRQRLQQATSGVAEYHLRASQWYEANSYMAEAFHHAIAAKDHARAADVAERAWQSMDDTFQTGAWLGWIKRLPEEVIRIRPVLCTQIGMAFMDAGEPEASERRLRDAERWLEGSAEGMVVVEEALLGALPAMIAMARAYNAQVQGDLSAAVKYAGLALQLIPEDDVFRRAQATVQLNLIHWANGDLEAARRTMDDWMNSMQQLGNSVFVVASAFAVADILIAQGRLREALRTYEQSLQLADEAGPAAQSITAHHQLGLALLYHEMGNEEAFTRHWQQAEDLGQHTTLVDWPHRWHVAQAHIKQVEGDFDAALDLLDEAKRVYVKNPVPDLRPVEALKAQVYLKQGRLTRAQDWAHERGLSVDDDLSYLSEFEHLTLARVLIAENQITQALSLLDRLLHAAEDGKRTGSVIEILIAQALAHQAQGDTPAALAVLERALVLAEPEGYVYIFVDEGEAMRLLIVDLRFWIEKQEQRESQRLIGYTNKLLAAFKQLAVVPQSKIQNPKSEILEPLSPRELEVLRLIEQGFSNQEIADRLFLALSTVKGYTRTIFDKLQVQRRTEAVARARELGLL
jgi:LuxR family transcriptional regulator, maltose regulon positive regulatory protein